MKKVQEKFQVKEVVWLEPIFDGPRIQVEILRNENQIEAFAKGKLTSIHAYKVREVSGSREWSLVPETRLFLDP